MKNYSIEELERIFSDVPLNLGNGARIFRTIPEKYPFLVMQDLGWIQITQNLDLSILFVVTDEGMKHYSKS
jgi:hypothetical protein|nr:MAG TPA: hypothetical protein [Caudoviricetes sp.]